MGHRVPFRPTKYPVQFTLINVIPVKYVLRDRRIRARPVDPESVLFTLHNAFLCPSHHRRSRIRTLNPVVSQPSTTNAAPVGASNGSTARVQISGSMSKPRYYLSLDQFPDGIIIGEIHSSIKNLTNSTHPSGDLNADGLPQLRLIRKLAAGDTTKISQEGSNS